MLLLYSRFLTAPETNRLVGGSDKNNDRLTVAAVCGVHWLVDGWEKHCKECGELIFSTIIFPIGELIIVILKFFEKHLSGVALTKQDIISTNYIL